MVLESVFNQLFQPYFYYSATLLMLSFISVKLLSKYCFFMDTRIKSMAYLLPLIIPVGVMLIFVPSPVYQQTYMTSLEVMLSPSPTSNFLVPYIYSVLNVVEIPSITGVICLMGIAAGTISAALMLLFNYKGAKKLLHVVEVEPDDYPWLQEKIAEFSYRLGVPLPKIGIIDDLKPNAFNLGHGKKATIVFSIGLLEVLDKEEVYAVAMHELSHLKNHDFFFKITCNALTAVSFFNPFAYFAASAVQRERELLADEKAASHLKEPTILGVALAKIFSALQNFPKESMLVSATSNLFITSSIARKPKLLAAHPSVSERLTKISAPEIRVKPSNRKVMSALFVSLLIISFSVVSCYALVDIPRVTGYPQSTYQPDSSGSVGGVATALPASDSAGYGGSRFDSGGGLGK
jgi:Zn-dependent protease with chaperone function